MNRPRQTVFLVDGSAFFYRAYYAFIRNPLINSKGENTSATFGFVNSLLKIIKDEHPDYLAVVFDTREPTFRHKMYDEYKSTRAKMPDDLVEQLPRIHQAVESLSIASFEMAGYEADDIIGTMARLAEKAGYEVWCVTGDKDFYQLVSENVGIYNPGRASEKPERMGCEEVVAKFGVKPELVIDKLALMGDSSDNVPGVPGVGPKTADKLLAQLGSLDGVLARHSEIAAKGLREKIATSADIAELSRKLVTIDTNVPIQFELGDLKRHGFDYDKVKSLFLELEFTSLLKQVLPEAEAPAEQLASAERPRQVEYRTVASIQELKALVAKLSQRKEVAVDTETTSLNTLEADLVGVSLCAEVGVAYYVPLGHTTDSKKNLPHDEALAVLQALLENPEVQKFGQNIKYDLKVFHRHGLNITPISFDSMLASYLLNPSSREHSLSFLAMKHFDYAMQPITDLIGSGRKQQTFDIVPVKQATFYAAEDADFTYRLRGELAPMIDDYELNNLFYNVELPLIRVLASMEEAGIRIDTDLLADLSVQMEERLEELRADIYGVAGGEFNINSTKQLGHVLFEKLGLPTKGKTAGKTGYSTDVRVLEELAMIDSFPRLILDYRQLTKLTNTYIDALPRLINAQTGRVHTSFNQAVTATGRLSSKDPNLQNIPVRTEEGRRIRRAFIPRDSDYRLLVADYSQIELRILAHYSQDKGLIEAFKNGEDIHTRTAAEVYGVAIEEVTSEQRRAAKTANFAVIYGVTAHGLSQQTEFDLTSAKQFIDTYFERYPGIRTYIDNTKQAARDQGFVTTMLNRRRYLPEINSKNFNVRQFAERTAINTPIQGTAADMIKLAMVRIFERMQGMRSRMVLQVHDELVFDAHKEELAALEKIVKTAMEKAVRLSVPVMVDMGVGDNWLEAK